MTDLMSTNIDQAKVLATLGLNAADPKAQALMLVCQRYDLDPLLKHIQIVQSQTYVTRDGFLHIAHKSGRFDGMVTEYERETPGGYECKVAVYRRDMSHPFTAVGRAKKSEGDKMADMALARAERRALRRAFDVAGISDHEPVEWEEVPDLVEPDGGVHQIAIAAKAETHQFDEPDVEFVSESSVGDGDVSNTSGDSPGANAVSARPVEPMTDAQRAHLFALVPKNMTRQERLEYVGALIDREITSSKDLTKDEASTVIELLKGSEQ